jgi:hypothetical protein
MKLRQFIITLLILSFLAGCSTSNRPPYSNEMQVTIGDEGLIDRRWHVPAGEDIRIQLVNQTQRSITWSILAPSGTKSSEAAWFSVDVAPSSTFDTHFRAPAAAGEYDVICISLLESETRWFAEIVVVQP